MPLISRALPIPSAFLLIVLAGLFILLAKIIYSLARKRKRLEHRTCLLQQWVRIEQAQPTVRYRMIEIKLPKQIVECRDAAPHRRAAMRT